MPKAVRQQAPLPEAPVADADRRAGRCPPWVARRPETLAILVSLLGLFVQVVGYSRGWAGDEQVAIVLWYVGFVVVVAPFAALLLVPGRTGHQRLGASLALTLVVYASWLLSNPLMSTRFDENLHVTTLVDLVEHAEFFQLNSMLPVSPHFPGLELATAGVHWLTGLPLFVCQVLVVATARVMFAGALFLLASRIGRSTAVGGMAVLLYAASNQFYFFNAQFSYQTVAIAMVMAAFYLLVRAFDSPLERPWTLLVTVQVCLGALAITHHLTSWIMLATLWTLALFFWFGEGAAPVPADPAHRRDRHRGGGGVDRGDRPPADRLPDADLRRGDLPAGRPPPGRRGARGRLRQRRHPHAHVGGDGHVRLPAALVPAPRPRRVGGLAARVHRRHQGALRARSSSPWRSPRCSSPGSPRRPARWRTGPRPSSSWRWRSSSAPGSRAGWTSCGCCSCRRPCCWSSAAPSSAADRTGSGSPARSWPAPSSAPWTATTVAVAEWAGRYLPDGSNVAADATFSRVIPNFADVTSVTQPAGFESVTPMFISESFDQTSLELILRNEVDFVVVDTRLVGQTVRSGSFYEGGAGYGEAAATVTPAMVEKFAEEPGFDLVLDGPVKIYDVRSLRGVPAPFEDRPGPGLPGTWTPWQVGLTARSCSWSASSCAAGCSTSGGSAPATPGASRW